MPTPPFAARLACQACPTTLPAAGGCAQVTDRAELADAELGRVVVAILGLLVLDARHVGARLGERDVLVRLELVRAARLRDPAVDVALAAVVGSDREPL